MCFGQEKPCLAILAMIVLVRGWHTAVTSSVSQEGTGPSVPLVFLFLDEAQQCIPSCLMLVKCIHHQTLDVTFRHLSSNKTLYKLNLLRKFNRQNKKRGLACSGGAGAGPIWPFLPWACWPLRDYEGFCTQPRGMLTLFRKLPSDKSTSSFYSRVT